MNLHDKCHWAFSRAFRATTFRNLEVKVGDPPLGTHIDSSLAQFSIRIKESEVAKVNMEAGKKVERGGNGGSRCEKEDEG
jgi:hypothetical protein